MHTGRSLQRRYLQQHYCGLSLSLRTIAVLLLAPVLAQSQIIITLNNSFIEQFKNRATITATFTVDKAHAHPNPPAKDGDMHIAGRAPEIELPTVAEIMNAAMESSAVNLIHSVEGTGKTVQITEHGDYGVNTAAKTSRCRVRP
jgi:hypothetical protein